MDKWKTDTQDSGFLARWMNGGKDPELIVPPSQAEIDRARATADEIIGDFQRLLRDGHAAQFARKLAGIRTGERKRRAAKADAAALAKEAQRLIATGTPAHNVASILARRGKGSVSKVRRAIRKTITS